MPIRDAELPEGHDVVVTRGPCPKCDTSRRYVTYADGHSHCFKCGHREGQAKGDRPKAEDVPRVTSEDAVQPLPGAQGYPELKARGGLKPDTLRKYGYFVGGYKGQQAQVSQYYMDAGTVAWQKVRLPNRVFPTIRLVDSAPSIADCWLFGRQVYGDRFDRKVIITEGELDALTVAQVLDFRVAVVSVNSGAKAAARNLKANYLWLDRFEEIILWLDDDEEGRAATEECAKLFKVGKVRVARVPGHKDASEVLQAGKPGDIEAAIYTATAWRPKGIVNARDSDADVRASRVKVTRYRWPDQMERLQEMTGGMGPGEVVYHVAGTGIGKSSVLREIQHSLIRQGVKIGVLSFEDPLRDMKLGIMSIEANERLALIPEPDPEDTKAINAYDEKMVRIHNQVFGGGLVELFDPQSAEWSMQAILGYARYCICALDCKVLFIDPLSFVATGIELTVDERRVLDKVAADFSKTAIELGAHIQISHHLKRTSGIPHEEGAPTSLNELRSSGGLANFAMCVIGWERNNQAAGDSFRVTQSRILKPLRRTGKSGLADVLYYRDDGRLIKSPIPFPPVGKPDQEGSSSGYSHRPGPIHSQPSGNEDY